VLPGCPIIVIYSQNGVSPYLRAQYPYFGPGARKTAKIGPKKCPKKAVFRPIFPGPKNRVKIRTFLKIDLQVIENQCKKYRIFLKIQVEKFGAKSLPDVVLIYQFGVDTPGNTKNFAK